jgi:hypothetical protein
MGLGKTVEVAALIALRPRAATDTAGDPALWHDCLKPVKKNQLGFARLRASIGFGAQRAYYGSRPIKIEPGELTPMPVKSTLIMVM